MTYTDEGDDISTAYEDDLLAVYLNIEGMSCQSCVKTIEQSMSQKHGVVNVKVLLDEKEGVITFSPKQTEAKIIADALEDMGFEASIKRIVKVLTGEQVVDEQKSNEKEEKEVHISVLGMTCQSCVKTINHALSTVGGVKDVDVSLQNKEAVIRYNPALTNPSALRDIIDEVGFEASLTDTSLSVVPQENISVSIEGMTCNSCVQTIEKNIEKLDGVNSITVSLEKKKAEISYDPSKTGAEQLRLAIDDMGFEASLISSGSDTHLGTNTKTAIINVEGMTCMSCVNTIKGGISTAPGVKSIEVSLSEKKAFIQYDPTLTNEESLAAQIEDMGFVASVPDSGEYVQQDFFFIFFFFFCFLYFRPNKVIPVIPVK